MKGNNIWVQNLQSLKPHKILQESLHWSYEFDLFLKSYSTYCGKATKWQKSFFHFAGWPGCAILCPIATLRQNERLTFHFLSVNNMFKPALLSQKLTLFVSFFAGWPGCAICIQLPLFIKTRGLCSRASTFHSCRHLWKMWRVQVCQRKGLAVLQRGRSQV